MLQKYLKKEVIICQTIFAQILQPVQDAPVVMTLQIHARTSLILQTAESAPAFSETQIPAVHPNALARDVSTTPATAQIPTIHATHVIPAILAIWVMWEESKIQPAIHVIPVTRVMHAISPTLLIQEIQISFAALIP